MTGPRSPGSRSVVDGASAGAYDVLTVTAKTVRRGDVIDIGGRARRITDIRAVHGGRQLRLHTGELLVVDLDGEYTVTRGHSPDVRG